MATPTKPKPKGKGTPPRSTAESPIMGNNTTKPEKGKMVDISMKVDIEYKKDVQQFALDHNMSITAIFKEGFEVLKKTKGGS